METYPQEQRGQEFQSQADWGRGRVGVHLLAVWPWQSSLLEAPEFSSKWASLEEVSYRGDPDLTEQRALSSDPIWLSCFWVFVKSCPLSRCSKGSCPWVLGARRTGSYLALWAPERLVTFTLEARGDGFFIPPLVVKQVGWSINGLPLALLVAQ